jgi:hypothetical protein
MDGISCLFVQLLQRLPHKQFDDLVQQYRGERYAKGFTCYQQLLVMIYLHLTQAHGLGEACDELRLKRRCLAALGLTKAPARSTVAYANEHRPAIIYRAFFQAVLQQVLVAAPYRPGRSRFKGRTLTLDSTTLELCCTLFPWAHCGTKRKAVKVHVLQDQRGAVPIFAVVTTGKVGDSTVATALTLPPGSLLVIDRGYNNYAFYAKLTRQKIYFLTRMLSNAQYTVERRLPVRAPHILADEIIRLSSDYAQERCTCRLRRLVVRDTTGKVVVLLTNHLTMSAETLAETYRRRWEIETFFRHLKQLLRIKVFVGHSPNAVAIQIWTALLTWLLLEYLKFLSTFGWTWRRLCALLRRDLFTCRPLQDWLNDPYAVGDPSPG